MSRFGLPLTPGTRGNNPLGPLRAASLGLRGGRSRPWKVRRGFIHGVLAALMGSALVTACDEPPRPTTVAIAPSTVELTSLGATRQLGAEVLDQYGSAMPGAEVSWSSDDPNTARVSETGLVRAAGNGATTITAAAGAAAGTATVKVMQTAASVTVSPSVDTIAIGDTVRFGAEAFDENGHTVKEAEFAWSSDDESVATVDESGLVRGTNPGTATISATAEAAGGSARIVVFHPDRVALEALYRATGGPRWHGSFNWLSDAPLDDWYGVATELGNVTELVLRYNGLDGPLPPELGKLANLAVLNLTYNDISGPIPPELGNLVNLEVLDLGANQLSGPLPPELGNPGRLRVLSLHTNQMTGPVPAELGRMSRLQEFTLSYNEEMQGPLPSELTSLRHLDVFLAGGTELCAPAGSGFATWLEGIYKRRIAGCQGDLPMAYLTQTVQSREFPVPLVAEEKALLRVFVTARKATGEGIPTVRARFYVDGRETHVEEIPGKSTPIPTEVDEGDLSKSANAEISADVIERGLEMVIEVDPDGTLDDDLGVPKRIPETGRLAVDVRAMPVFDLTVIPFVWTGTHDSSIVDLVVGMADDPDGDSLLWHTRTLLPIGDLEVTAHEPVLTSSRFDPYALLDRTVAIRAMEGGTGHYQGMMSWSTPAGVARLPGRSSFSTPHSFVIAHELGHNLDLHHAPCGLAGGPDPSYPHPYGSIGVWGYDFRGDSLVQPSRRDLMSYCRPMWISDYHLSNALRFRLSDADSVGLPYLGARRLLEPRRSLLLWGGAGADGVPYLEPAFVVEAPPTPPQSAGEYRLTERSRGGTELFSLSFAMPVVADGDGSSSFAFTIPVGFGWEHSLHAIVLTGPGGSAALEADSDRPVVILRDPRSGQVRAILHDVTELDIGQEDVGAALGAGPGLEALVSRGIPDSAAWRR